MGTLVSALGRLFILTACMAKYDATYSNAVHAGSSVVSCSIMSWIRYQTTPVNAYFYVCGLIVILCGVAVLVKESDNDSDTVCSEKSDDETAPLSDEEALLENGIRRSSSSLSLDLDC